MKAAALRAFVTNPSLGGFNLGGKARLLENSASAIALLAMASLPIAEAGVRLFYPSGIPGAANWVQYLTLWVAFLGAMIAARRGELLSLDAAQTFLSGRLETAVKTFTAGVTVADSPANIGEALEADLAADNPRMAGTLAGTRGSE